MLSSHHSVLKGVSWKWRKGNRVFRTIGPHKGFNYCRRSGSGRGGCVLRRREDWEKTSLGKWWIFDLYLICTQIVPFSIYRYYQHRVLLWSQRDGATILVSFVFGDVACIWYPGLLCRGHIPGPFSNWRRGSSSLRGGLMQWVRRGCRWHEHVPKETHCTCKVILQGKQETITCAWPPGCLSTGWTSTSIHISASFWASRGLFRKEHSPASWVSSHFIAAESLRALKTKSLCITSPQGQRIHEAQSPQHGFRAPVPFSKAVIWCVFTTGHPFCQNNCC